MGIEDFAFGLDRCFAASADVAAPTAGTVIVTIASGNLPAGTYDVAFITRNRPTAGAEEVTDAGEHNMELRKGATVFVNRLRSNKQPGASYLQTDIQLDGSTALSINATANAAASTIYSATLLVVRTS